MISTSAPCNWLRFDFLNTSDLSLLLRGAAWPLTHWSRNRGLVCFYSCRSCSHIKRTQTKQSTTSEDIVFNKNALETLPTICRDSITSSTIPNIGRKIIYPLSKLHICIRAHTHTPGKIAESSFGFFLQLFCIIHHRWKTRGIAVEACCVGKKEGETNAGRKQWMN